MPESTPNSETALTAVADVGNSWIKYAIVDPNDQNRWLCRKRVQWKAGFDLDLPSNSCRWTIASVSKPGERMLRKFLSRSRPDDSIVELPFSQVPIQHAIDTPQQTGIDRFCAAAGAVVWLQQENKELPAIVVDIGTAVTVDAIDRDQVFLGGTIFAGPLTALQALSQQTDSLPDLSQSEFPLDLPPIGKNTEQAIKAGTLYALVGAVREIVARQSQQWNQEPEVVLTGGGAALMEPHVPSNWHFVDDLVLLGIRAAVISQSLASKRTD